jgi:hypothetical protein
MGRPLLWTPPAPDYPEYADLYEQARTNRFVDPTKVYAADDIWRRRGADWTTAVLGKHYRGVTSISAVESRLLELADAAGIDPPLPAWVLEDRAETEETERARAAAAADQAARELAAWNAALAGAGVALEVRENTNSRGYGNRRDPLRHAVPTVPARSGPGAARRRHAAHRALCETATRKPLALGEPTDRPATCQRCLDHARTVIPA